MKKTILFLLLLSFLLSLAACKDVDEITLAEQVFVDPGTEVLEEPEPEDNDPGGSGNGALQRALNREGE